MIHQQGIPAFGASPQNTSNHVVVIICISCNYIYEMIKNIDTGSFIVFE